MRHRETFEPRGFGFITFEKASDASKVKLGKSHGINNVKVEVRSAVHKNVSLQKKKRFFNTLLISEDNGSTKRGVDKKYGKRKSTND